VATVRARVPCACGAPAPRLLSNNTPAYEERGRLPSPGAERERLLAEARRLYDAMGASGLSGRLVDGVIHIRSSASVEK
jgi:hypothetical protein